MHGKKSTANKQITDDLFKIIMLLLCKCPGEAKTNKTVTALLLIPIACDARTPVCVTINIEAPVNHYRSFKILTVYIRSAKYCVIIYNM